LKALECPFGVVGKILINKISWNLFDKIWIQNVGNIDLKMIFVTKNQINFKKSSFEKKNQLRR
jgi:hypothetical protein